MPIDQLHHALVGLDEIGRYFRRSRSTARRWVKHEDLPAARLPDGSWTTTVTLLDKWLLARRSGAKGGEAE